MLEKLDVTVHLNSRPTIEDLTTQDFDDIIIATGIVPRQPEISGLNHHKVVSYVDVLSKRKAVGQTVAILGAGGIGFDVAEFLVGDPGESLNVDTFYQAWGVSSAPDAPGGLTTPAVPQPARDVYMFQRKNEPLGRSLGKTTGWILKSKLRRNTVSMIPGASYDRIDDEGLHYTVDSTPHTLNVDHVILCTGQISDNQLATQLHAAGLRCHVIGGADYAEQLDAVRAIDQAVRLAVTI